MRAILERLGKQLAKDFEGLELGWPEDGQKALQSEGVQHRLPGGKRKVLAVITSRRTAEEILGNMGLLEPRPPPPNA